MNKSIDKIIGNTAATPVRFPAGGGGNDEPFVITFDDELTQGDKTHSEVKEAVEQGKIIIGRNVLGGDVYFTSVTNNAQCVTLITADLAHHIRLTCWKDMFPDTSGWQTAYFGVASDEDIERVAIALENVIAEIEAMTDSLIGGGSQ